VWAGWLGASSASMAVGSGAPPAKWRAPVWASVFSDPSGMVDLARAAAHWRGGELTRWLGFQSLWVKIHRRIGTIYRAFCTET
jgi:hypothetical protein